MQDAGFRIWYDEGIDPGTEWDENIANHVQNCGYFLAMISKNYLASENCCDELNFARDENKERLLVYLEETQLPAGMRMRLGRLQAIFQYTYQTMPEMFYDKLFSANNINLHRSAAKRQTPEQTNFRPAPTTFTQTAPRPAPTPAPAQRTAPSGTFMLYSFGSAKLAVIKAVRMLTGYGLADAKAFVESLPKQVVPNCTEAEYAEAIKILKGTTAVYRFV